MGVFIGLSVCECQKIYFFRKRLKLIELRIYLESHSSDDIMSLSSPAKLVCGLGQTACWACRCLLLSPFFMDFV